MSELPILDDTRCTGCGDCVFVCPVNCLEMAVSLPWMPRPGDCISCSLCALVCPVQAIHLAPEEADPVEFEVNEEK